MGNPVYRRWAIAGFSLLTAILIFYVSQFNSSSSTEQVEVSKMPFEVNLKTPHASKVVNQAYALLPREANSEKITNLFIVDRPPIVKSKPEKPIAPPLPYIYMGKITDKNGLSIFLTRNEKVYVVKDTGQIDLDYYVDLIRPPFIEITYLPLKEKQVLNIGVIK